MQINPNDVHDLETLRKHFTELQFRHQRLEHDYRVLHKMLFGRRSERREEPPPPDAVLAQGYLFIKEVLAEASQQAEAHGVEATVEAEKPAPTKRKPKGRRSKFPASAPVVTTVVELPEDRRQCGCGDPLHECGEEVTVELERVEVTVVHEIRRKKYACRKCQEGVRTAPWRGKVIAKGLLGPGFLAHVIAERFGNHMPYHRLEKKYESEGLALSRSVLCASMARVAELLEPIAKELRAEVIAAPAIHTDDTPVVIANHNGQSKKGRVWVYVNQEGRYWYDFTDSRKRDGPVQVLGEYSGYIHADAYKGYDVLYLPGGSKEVGCWAHARRKFVDAEVTEPSLAKEAVDRIRGFFRIEKKAREQGLGPGDRLVLRKAETAPRVEAFHEWLNIAEGQVLPRGPLARAIAYVRNQWTALTRFLDDGRLAISNNAAERALRPIAVGRKNWLFFQREGGGRVAATLMSLLMTCRDAGIDPRIYFRDVLLRIATCSNARDLTPHRWKERFWPEVERHTHLVLDRLVRREATGVAQPQPA